ncbi:MAG TPA: acetoacetate--CoA ligase, partial [Gemmatimonadaceae bacterium]|nr:acetoacetate--CoA ligase [Gemmatimonadaceae bacterium]
QRLGAHLSQGAAIHERHVARHDAVESAIAGIVGGGVQPIWVPSAERVARANLTRFIAQVRELGERTASITDYDTLYEWSIRDLELFWLEVVRFCGVVSGARDPGLASERVLVGRDRVAPPDPVLGPRWFVGSRLNFAENLLRYRDDRDAVVAWNERGAQRRLTYAELHTEVARVATALREAGVRPGDRVAGFMPNLPETVIAMLAATSIGAIWSSCSPDFGVGGVLDRFGQIQPRVLFCAESYLYNGREIDCLERVREIADRIPEIERVVVVPYLRAGGDLSAIRGAVAWDEFARDATTPLTFEPLPFDAPLYIMYSSGTTGLPKCMVHGVGGTLIQHLKELALLNDIKRDDRVFYFTTCGWMMWNWLVSCLAVGSTIVLYDGAPLIRNRPILWDMAVDERITVFGTSAKWLALAEKEGLRPMETHDLSALDAILSTGSPLAAHSFDYVYSQVKQDVRLSSISGGTDIISCFAGGNPLGPVYRGELQARSLGMKVEIFDEQGSPAVGQPGELVCTAPFPSMPVSFWNDPDSAKYRAAYFETYPNVWRHGDWAELTTHGGVIIYGRSDATLNPGGVRIGTAEIYRQVERLPEVLESVVIGQDVGGEDVRIVLFVRLVEGLQLTEMLKEKIRETIRANTSPHHVPKRIVQVADIPRTISGKITELAVRDVVHGREVKNVDALANPAALELFRNLPELAM